MSRQAEALRLADVLDSVVGGALCNRAAAELRRQHAENEALRAEVEASERISQASLESVAGKWQEAEAENERLRAALNKLEYDSEGYIKRYPEDSEVKAALKEAK